MSQRLLKLFKTLFPWLVAGALLYYLFHKIPPAQVLHSLHYVPPMPFLLFALAYFLVLLVLDTWGLAKVVSQFSATISFKELWPARCVSYLLGVVNYNAGQVGMALYLKKTRGASLFKTLGAIFFVTAVDLYWVITLAFIGSFFFEFTFQGISLPGWVRRIAYVAFAALFLHLAFWNRWFAKISPVKLHFRFADWLRGRHLFQPFHHAQLKDYFKIALFRLPIHMLIIISFWILVRLFGASIGWKDIFATVPVIFLFGALPITPGGLGTVQIATVELLKHKISSPLFAHGNLRPEEILFALSLSWMAVNYLWKALFGLYYWLSRPHSLFQESPSPQAGD